MHATFDLIHALVFGEWFIRSRVGVV